MEVLFVCLLRKGGMPDGDKGKKTDTYSSERAGGESGQASIECERTETSQEGSVLPEEIGRASCRERV